MAASSHPDRPTILIVTPEITYLPPGMGNMAQRMSAKAGGLADVSASLVSALFSLGADVHVAMPNYRRMFQGDVFSFHERELRRYHEVLPEAHIHLAEDRIFYYREQVYSNRAEEAMKIALIFQREVINHIVPHVRPDLIHCNDWMTALIPGMARRRGIKSLFTVHNIHTRQVSLSEVEETGIDAAEFWMNLYFAGAPDNYDNARSHLPVDLLTSGIFAAHFINTVSPRFLWEIVEGWHPMVPHSVRQELRNKYWANCATGILNAPDASYNPKLDATLVQNFDDTDFTAGKAANKEALQAELHLKVSASAPMVFWPSRLDPMQKGPQLLTEILYQLVSDYWERDLQVVVVANGPYERWIKKIIHDFNLFERVAIVDFDERLSRRAYAASDFMIMPSQFEPCGLPQMTAPIYGSLPIVHATGGLYDTVRHLDVDESTGNGFRFETYDSKGFRWAIDRAMEFYALPEEIRIREISRIMRQSRNEFSHEEVARNYIAIYEQMLARPLVEKEAGEEIKEIAKELAAQQAAL
ncbi:glycogen/starch synthase [Luteolibacter pohnpeiensis]|uniref:starch synthase n=1 Tax=Luteolibacter pohnpeiensis TaxID=454153 RepID=A0A934VS62_9BACT|nr:glycogen/starch synthase [Luteolibacter pohnpeiensis]MBK1883941.1 glycogen/starch synthase [Luteolibacter pohnpeiensis]